MLTLSARYPTDCMLGDLTQSRLTTLQTSLIARRWAGPQT